MKELKDTYLQFKQKLDALPSSCVDVTHSQVLERLKTDKEQPLSLLTYLNQLTAQDLKTGVLLYDLSGIGLYTLGPLVAAHWASQRCFTAFKTVILLPIERRHLFHLQDSPQSIEDFFKIWNLTMDPSIQAEDLLIVISGHSGEKLRANTTNREEENKRQQEWLTLIDTLKLHYIIVSNQFENLSLEPHKIIPVSLQPFDLGVYHLKDRPNETAYTLPGSIVLSEAKAAIEQTLFKEKTDQVGSIRTSPEWHQQVFNFRHINELSKSSVTIPHLYLSVRIQEFIKTIAHALDSTITTKSSETPITLSTAQEWFCAAIMHKSEQSHYAYYRVGNDLIVRNLENNYIAGIPEGALAPLSTTHPDKTMNDLKYILQHVIANDNFERYNAQEMMGQLHHHKNELCKTKKGTIDQRDYKYFTLLLKLVDQFDPQQKSKHLFSKENTKNITYHAFQIKIDEEIQRAGLTHITQTARQILKGHALRMPNFTTALSATMIAEPSRYELPFLIMLCLLDVIENDVVNERHYWHGMFAHPQHDQEDTLENAMLADIAHLLGGYQVMSHGNSRHQTDPSNPQPQHGVHWVDFKSVVVLIRWLALSFEREKALNPHLIGELLTNPFENKPVFKDSFQEVMQAGLGRAHTYLFDRLSRRVESLDYMLTSQQPLREVCPLFNKFEPWATQQLYPSNARIRYPDSPGDCLRLMCYTPFGELCNGILDIKPESRRFVFSLTSIHTQGEKIHPLAVNKLFHDDPEKIKEVFLTNLILQDPDFYQCYFFMIFKIYYPQENHPACVYLLMRLKKNIPQNHQHYQDYTEQALKLINLSIYYVSLMLNTTLTDPKQAEKLGQVYCYRAYLNYLAEKPFAVIMDDLKQSLQPTIKLPQDYLNFAQTLFTLYQSNTTPDKALIDDLAYKMLFKK